MTARVAGRTAIVTGAASTAGIGFATARALALEGARVLLSDVDGAAAVARAAELKALGLAAEGLEQDVTREEGWIATLAAAEAAFGPPDILVNNAGVAVLSLIEGLEPADWSRQIDVNLTSVYLGCRAMIAHLRRQRRGGAIVNVSSAAGLVGMRRCTAYSASKGGVRLMTKSLALEVAAEDIRINSVHPGVIATEIQKVATADGGAHSARIHAMIPMQRQGRAMDVAAMILFLASDEAAYVTGAEFAVDGGLTAQ